MDPLDTWNSLLLDFDLPLPVLCLMDHWGLLPKIPPTTVFIEDVLTGRVQSSQLSHVFADALFNDNSEQALRPRNPTLLLAFAEAAQHGMQLPRFHSLTLRGGMSQLTLAKKGVSTSPAPQMVQGTSSPLGSVQPGPTG